MFKQYKCQEYLEQFQYSKHKSVYEAASRCVKLFFDIE